MAPILFDLAADPDELVDLGRDPGKADAIHRLETALKRWLQTPANRITVSDAWVTSADEKFPHFDPLIEQGVLIGYWDEAELAGQHAARERWLAKR